MLSLQAQDPLYLIVDAVDECPDRSGMSSAREQVLGIAELVGFNNTFGVLHEQSGKKKDIIDYINSVVYSDAKMRRWREEDKRLVVETISERVNGTVLIDPVEQVSLGLLSTLNRCGIASHQTLDETYERILRDMNEVDREHAHRLLQCLTVAIQPLRDKELADVLVVDFDAARRGGIPTVNANWRPSNSDEGFCRITRLDCEQTYAARRRPSASLSNLRLRENVGRLESLGDAQAQPWPPGLGLSSVPTGDAFMKILQAHDSHVDALCAQATQQDGGGATSFRGNPHPLPRVGQATGTGTGMGHEVFGRGPPVLITTGQR
ncbi:hypothetical protein BGW80DRAFT_1447389 [Lactifluus volemus]|nr:hypothetical protein BGW80DRAFT_1447389 [Lactifluus volemus]